jgi:hypothetical protein
MKPQKISKVAIGQLFYDTDELDIDATPGNKQLMELMYFKGFLGKNPQTIVAGRGRGILVARLTFYERKRIDAEVEEFWESTWNNPFRGHYKDLASVSEDERRKVMAIILNHSTRLSSAAKIASFMEDVI